MATASDLIRRALRLIRAIDPGEPPTAHEERDSLVALNAMLSLWSIERQSIYTLVVELFPLTGADSYTIGPGGDFDTSRPVALTAALLDGAPLRLLTQDEYFRGMDGYTYTPSVPLGVMQLRGVGAGTISLESWKPLVGALALADPLNLPEGYEEAIAYNLAIRLAPEFGKSVSQEVALVADSALKSVKRKNANARTSKARLDDLLPARHCGGVRWQQ